MDIVGPPLHKCGPDIVLAATYARTFTWCSLHRHLNCISAICNELWGQAVQDRGALRERLMCIGTTLQAAQHPRLLGWKA